MKTYIYIIIITYITHPVFCKVQLLLPAEAYPNSSLTELYSVCPVELFRRKRTIEYTRWRPKPEATTEFIVKVFDEDPPPRINAPSENKLTFNVGDDIQDFSGGEQPSPGWEDVTLPPERSPNQAGNPQFLAHRPPLEQQYAPVTQTLDNKPVTPPPTRDGRFNAWISPLKRSTLENFEDLRLKHIDKPIESTPGIPERTDVFITRNRNSDESDLRKFLGQNVVSRILHRTERNDLSGDDSYNLFYPDYLNNKPADRDYTEEEGNGIKTTPTAKTAREFSMNTNVHDDEIKETIEKIPPVRTTTEIIQIPERFDANHSRKHCSLLNIRPFVFNTSASLPEIVSKLKQWSESPLAEWVDITYGNMTTMENPIYMMIVDDPSSGQMVSAKETVMVVAGIQGRDHHAVASAMFLLSQLIEHTKLHNDLLDKYRFWIIPVFNPDGYEYSTSFPGRRAWKKNLRQNWELCKDGGNKLQACISCENLGLRCFLQPCYGTNLDRNFEYQWIPGTELRLEHPCGELYAGDHQLSETESFALTTYLEQAKMQPTTFIAFKEGGTLGVMYPYSHTKKKRDQDTVHKTRASAAAAAAYGVNNRMYVSGQTSEFLPLYAGGIEDWMDGHLGIEGSYAIMMYRPTETHYSKPTMDRVVYEAFAATEMLLMQKYSEPPKKLRSQMVNVVSQPTYLFSSARHIRPCLVILQAIPALIAIAHL